MKYNILYLLLFCAQFCQAQTFFPKKNYPNTFQNPLEIPLSIIGNFGECRPNHFHSGIDIRTNAQENQLVHAVADGFISRVKIEAGGFGNAIYVTHFNGYTTLYAHLNKFYPELENYVRAQQYKSKNWAVDLIFMPHQFPIRKGAIIAWSGNTGSSQGPHLHLEIRDTKTENPLNGLLFFSWKDGKAPIIKKLAMYDGSRSIYEQSPVILPVVNNKLSKETITINSDKVFFGINTDDFMEIATGTLGIFEMRLYVDDKPFFAWQMDNISYDITRYMNAMADYKTKKNNGPWIQLCRRLPNDKLPVYKDFSNTNGVIDLPESTTKNIRIEVVDTRNNKSSISFAIKSNTPATNKGCDILFKAGEKKIFQNEYIQFTMPAENLYDNICFTTCVKPTTNQYSYIYQVHNPQVPLHTYFDIYFTPKTIIPSSLKDKIAIVRYPYGTDKDKKGKVATLENGKVKASIRDFGNYEIVIDQAAPSISTLLKNNMSITKLTRLNFVAKDETTSIKKVEAFVDGLWLRIVQKGNNYYYEMDDHFPIGTHQLVVMAYDENNNVSKINYTLTR